MLTVKRAQPAYPGDRPHWHVILQADDRHDGFHTVLYSESHQGKTWYYNDHDSTEKRSLWKQVEHVLRYFA